MGSLQVSSLCKCRLHCKIFCSDLLYSEFAELNAISLHICTTQDLDQMQILSNQCDALNNMSKYKMLGSIKLENVAGDG